MKKLLMSAASAIVLAGAASADTITIYTGGAPSGEGSAYHEGIGQGVADFLAPIADDLGMEISLVPTSGAVDNADRLAEHEGIAFGIGQGGLSYAPVEAGDVQILRNDLPGECAMSFTTEPRITEWADIVENAARVTWVVPENSGSEAFIRKLYAEDLNFAGKTPRFEFVDGAENIVATVTNPANRGTVGFYYAYPRGSAGLVKMAADADATVFGVLSPDIARQDDAYYLNRRAPYKMTYLGFGETMTARAMCSGSLLMAADPSSIEDPWMAADAEQIFTALKEAPAGAFVPSNGPMAKMMAKVEELSDRHGISEMVSDLETQISERTGR